jgi:hypothetical protein
MNINTRVFGALCMIGNAIWVADSIRWAVSGSIWDTVDIIVSVIAAIGGICGILGLVALKATGTHPILRLLSYLPVLGFLFTIANASSKDLSTLIGFLVQTAGMVVVGILTLAAKTWSGWRKFTPLLVVLAWPIGWAVQPVFGVSGLANLIIGAAWVLLGYAVQSSAAGRPVRQVASQPVRE